MRKSPGADRGLANLLFHSSIKTDRHPLLAETFAKTSDGFIRTLFTKELVDGHREEDRR